MSVAFSKLSGKVVIVDPVSTRRFMTYETVRNIGFAIVETYSEMSSLVEFLEVEEPTWIIVQVMKGSDPNVLQVLKLLSDHPHLMKVRVSIFLSEDEKYILPLAFEMGLMSYHITTSIKDQINGELMDLVGDFKKFDWNSTRLSASYLRNFLIEGSYYKHLTTFQRQLCQRFPGDAYELVRLGESLALSGESRQASEALNQALLIEPEMEAEIKKIYEGHLQFDENIEDCENDFDEYDDGGAKSARVNVLGVRSCTIVDSDSTIHHILTSILTELGVREILSFYDGDEAWRAISSKPEPGLIIQEWRLPGLTGPLLVQRIRQHGFVQVPIFVLSSLVKAGDAPLLKEMGVASVIEKPFEQPDLIRAIVWSLQQHRNPTEQISLERRIRSLLEERRINEAVRLLEVYNQDDRINDSAKKIMQSEILYAEAKYSEARELAISAFKEAGENLELFNLLGKIFIKMNCFPLALKCLDKAQTISPMNIERLCKIAQLENHLGNQDEAMQILQKVDDLDPSCETALTTKCGIAIANNQVDGAKAIMAQLDSTHKLLALMNSHAIAMIHNNQFENGIELYKRTLSTLPETWSKSHDAVTYNIGLAYTRYGELDKAEEMLKQVRGESAVLKKKADSLLRKLVMAKSRKMDLVLSSKDANLPTGEDRKSQIYQSASVFEINTGDLCCYRIFRAMDLTDKRALDLICNSISYTKRQAIQSEHSLAVNQ